MSRHDRVRGSAAVAIIGGDGRWSDQFTGAAKVRVYPSAKNGGNGRSRSVLAAIRARAFDIVLVLVRHIGHSEHHAIVAACASAGVPARIVLGGMTAAARALHQYVDEVDRDR